MRISLKRFITNLQLVSYKNKDRDEQNNNTIFKLEF